MRNNRTTTRNLRSSAMIGILALLSGCGALSDPNAATEENFKAVLEPLVGKLACAELPMSDAETLQHRGADVKADAPYPLVGAIGYGFNFGSGKWVEGGVFPGDPGPENAYRKLSEFGALDRKETEVSYTEEQMPFGMAASQRPHKYAIYTPTASFKELFATIPSTSNNGQPATDIPAICYGTGKITSIQFTIPEDGQAKSSRVDYTWSAEPVSDAARQLYDQNIILTRKPPLSGKETVTLVLTNNGWQQMERGF